MASRRRATESPDPRCWGGSEIRDLARTGQDAVTTFVHRYTAAALTRPADREVAPRPPEPAQAVHEPGDVAGLRVEVGAARTLLGCGSQTRRT